MPTMARAISASQLMAASTAAASPDARVFANDFANDCASASLGGFSVGRCWEGVAGEMAAGFGFAATGAGAAGVPGGSPAASFRSRTTRQLPQRAKSAGVWIVGEWSSLLFP